MVLDRVERRIYKVQPEALQSVGYIEGTNLKAKDIIRRAYGYRDKEYMKIGVAKKFKYLTTSPVPQDIEQLQK